MPFLAPAWLFGLAALALPVYVHLLRQHKTTPLPFPSLMFFEQRTQSSIKHRRLRYLLLMALRLLLLFLIVLAFANPYRKQPVAAARGETMLIVAVDDSFSMREGTRMAEAKREAHSILASRRPQQLAQVMTIGAGARFLTEPTAKEAELKAAVESIRPGDGRSRLAEFSRALRSLAESSKQPMEAHLVSDLQKSGLPDGFSDLQLPELATLKLHPVGKADAANWAVENVMAPAVVWDPKKARVQVTVSGYGAQAAQKTVSLVVQGKPVGSKTAAVPANGRATVEFIGLEAPYGFARCEARIDGGDALAADDRMLFAVERSDPRRVLLVHEGREGRSPLYFRTALAAGSAGAFALDAVPVERTANLAMAKYAFVVVSDVLSLPAVFEQELAKYVRGGGAVLIAAGPATAKRAKIPVTGETIVEGKYFSRAGARFEAVGASDPAHPSLRLANRWEGVKFYYAVRLEPKDGRIVARLADQTPILIDQKFGEGRVLTFTSGLDNVSNDFPVQAGFVPFIEQTARYLAGVEDRGAVALVDSHIELRSATERTVSVEVIDPDGKRPMSLAEAAQARTFTVTREGYYEVRRANGRHDVIAVSADRRESDLTRIPDEALALWSSPDAKQVAQASAGGAEREQTVSYWWYVMAAALAAMLIESFVASRYLGVEQEAA